MFDGPFVGTEILAAGIVTPGALRGVGYRRVLPNVYERASAESDLAARSRAAFLWSGRSGVLGGYSAAEVLAAPCAPADAPAELIVPGRHCRTHGGLVVRQDRLAEDELWRYGELAVTTPVRTAYDLARRAPLTEAVTALDALAGRFGFAPAEVLDLATRYRGARGARQLPRAVELARPLAESPMESRLRLVLVLGGLPEPAVQHPVVDDQARLVARVDLAYPDALLAIEYEGAHHFTQRGVIGDVHRYTQLVDLGWRVYRYLASDVYQRPDRIVAQIGNALAGCR